VCDRIAHFNDHPDTTREDIDKLVRIFHEELDAEGAS
jgi:hypothetical protein